jgi:transposase
VNILDLDDWDVTGRRVVDGEQIVNACLPHPPTACPACGAANLYGHGRRFENFRDLTAYGKKTVIRVERRRFKCRQCGQVFSESLPNMDSKHRATTRCVEWVAQQALARPFANVADEIGLNEITVRRIFTEYVEVLNKEWETKVETPAWLGIDEVKLAGSMRCMMADVLGKSAIDLLPKRDKATVAARISKMPNRDQIRVVVIDMWRQYRQVAREVLPQAEVVVDRFHVERLATRGLEAIRKSIRDDLTPSMRKQLKHDRFLLLTRPERLKDRGRFILETWMGNFPSLEAAYEVKEGFYRIYDHGEPETAGEMLDEWVAGIPKEMAWAFKDLTTALRGWRPEILGFFKYRVTNAYTEYLNGAVKQANRLGRGHSFETIRAKLLFHIAPQREASAMVLQPVAAGAFWVYASDLTVFSEVIDNALDAHLGQGISTTEEDPDESDEIIGSTSNVG